MTTKYTKDTKKKETSLACTACKWHTAARNAREPSWASAVVKERKEFHADAAAALPDIGD